MMGTGTSSSSTTTIASIINNTLDAQTRGRTNQPCDLFSKHGNVLARVLKARATITTGALTSSSEPKKVLRRGKKNYSIKAPKDYMSLLMAMKRQVAMEEE
jgi:hypothetical protein